jgi:hypothetical protein
MGRSGQREPQGPRAGYVPRRLAWPAMGVCGALLLGLGACSSKSITSTTPSPTVTPTVAATVTPMGSSTPTPAKTTPAASPSAQAVVQNGTAAVTDANDGQTVTLHVGNHLQVALASTYWQFQPSSDASVLRAEGSPAASRSPGCVPGAGCGTVAVTFTAVAPGHATVVATRTSCGEAMACQGSAGHYQVEVVVAA